MKIRRDIVLIALLGVVALVFGVFLVMNRPGAAIDAFKADAKAQAQRARPSPATAEQFRATVCAASPCVLVEAGGLAFIVGAGPGAAAGLEAHGLMRPDIDGVVLGDLSLETIEGLPGLARAALSAGRTEPLKVFGPQGVVPLVDGANLMLGAASEAQLEAGIEGEDQGIEGQVVFDSGVVSVRAFGAGTPLTGRVHRFDFAGKSLVVSGCSAQPADIVAAARGTRSVSGIIAASAPGLVQANPAAGGADCLTVDKAVQAISQAKLSAAVLVPLYPSADLPGALAAWRQVVASENAGAAPAGAGSVIDLTGEKPAIRLAD